MEVFPIGPAGRFFDVERCVYVRTVRFKKPACRKKPSCVSVCLCVMCVCRARAGRDF